MKRREFVKLTAMAGAAAMWPWRTAYAAYAQSLPLIKFGAGQKLRYFGIDIPTATPNTSLYPGVDYYQISMRQYQDQLHPSLGPTTLRGFANTAATGAQKHLEGAILATVNKPVRIKWSNELPDNIPLPVDPSLVAPFAFGKALGNDRVAPHLHGGLVPWPSDGGPFHWFSNNSAVRGPSVIDWLPDASGALTDDYYYPNVQTARFMWYHDHAVGLTRLNPYMGLASGYILTDPAEGLLGPNPAGTPTLMKMLAIPEGDLTRQVHLVVQDKIFAPSPYNGNNASNLWYPDFYDTQFFGAPAKGGLPLPTPSTVSEFWGDTMLVNGTVFPYIEVEPRRYRFRLLNACNTRFLSLRLVSALGRTFPNSTEPDLTKPGPALTLIGTEGGFLDGTLAPKGVVYNNTAAMPLVVSPAERMDVIIDFSQLANAATKGNGPLCYLLHNDAPVPFPGGTPLGDFFPGNNKLPMPPAPGYGPNTRTLLQFRIYPLGALTGNSTPDPAPDPAWALPPAPAPTAAPVRTRDLALYETADAYGRLQQNLGTLPLPLAQLDPPTEVVHAGTVETWRVFNTTADTHPMHFHYFNVRVVRREPFSWRGGMPNITGNPLPPDPAEQGWKETVKFNPGECTTLLIEMPQTTNLAPVPIPPSPRLASYNDPQVAGAEYVWHCHILEHEEHDMMRPLVVQG